MPREVAARALGQGGPELELPAADHGGAGQHRLRHHLFHEPRRSHHRDQARGHLRLVQHPAHAAVVVGVAVAVDHRGHRPVAAVGAVEVEAGAGHLGGDERVDDDHPALALDEGHVGEVEAAHLVDALGDLEEAVVEVQARLAPEARVDGGRRLRAGQECVVAQAPHHAALRVLDLDLGQGRHEAARGVLEVPRVVERQRLERRPLARAGDRRRVLGAVRAHERYPTGSGVTRSGTTEAPGRTRNTSGAIFTLSDRLPPPRMIHGRSMSPPST